MRVFSVPCTCPDCVQVVFLLELARELARAPTDCVLVLFLLELARAPTDCVLVLFLAPTVCWSS